MNFPVFPSRSLACKAGFLDDFFIQSHDALFIYDAEKQQFVYYNLVFSALLQVSANEGTPLSLRFLERITHEDDRHVLHKCLNKTEGETASLIEGENIRCHFTIEKVRYYNLRTKPVKTENDSELLLGIFHDVTEKLEHEQEQKKSDKTLRELSFITSHELRHEYAKIQSVVQLLDSPGVNEEERKSLIGEVRNAIQMINGAIFKINHKLSFNQSDQHFKHYTRFINFKRIILIDDDELTNTINKRLIQKIVADTEVAVFTKINEALLFLEEHDLNGDYLILLDVNFPRSSGWEFLEKYKRFLVQSRVIVLSSSIDTLDREKARKYSTVVDYITKPLSLDLIREVLQH